MTLFTFITNNPIISTVIIAITIVGFIFTYKSTPQKKLKFIITDNELITNKQSAFSKLKISYDGNNVDKLTVTKITLWNASFPAIRRSDIAPTAPLTLLIDTGDILDVSVLKGNDTANRVSVEQTEDKQNCITFEYLNRKEGGLIQVVHTGGSNSIEISKTLIGGKIVTTKNPNTSLIKTVLMSVFSTAISFIVTLAALVLAKYWGANDTVAIILFFAVFVLVIIAVMYVLSREFIPKNCRQNILARIKR